MLLNILNTAQRTPQIEDSDASRVSKEEETRKMLMEPFRHIKWSFLILTVMSVLTFMVGMAFLIAALAMSIAEGTVTSSTLTIAGLGLADFLILFYRRPWQDIAVGLSNSQQARIIATSYLSGVSILPSKGPEAIAMLHKHTRASVELLEEFTEPRDARERTTRDNAPSEGPQNTSEASFTWQQREDGDAR